MKENTTGWIKLSRKFVVWEFFDDPKAIKVFLYMLLQAESIDNHTPNLHLKRGEFCFSFRDLSLKLRITLQELRTILKKFEASEVIAIKTNNHYSIATILEYSHYQGNPRNNTPKTAQIEDLTANDNTQSQFSTHKTTHQATHKITYISNTPSNTPETAQIEDFIENSNTPSNTQNNTQNNTPSNTQNNTFLKNNKEIKEENNTHIDACEKKIKNQIPPKMEDLKNYISERVNGIDAEYFFNFYESKDWMIGKNKMKDWQAAVRTWEQKDKQEAAAKQQQAPRTNQNAKFNEQQNEAILTLLTSK